MGRKKLFYGWYIVAACFIILMLFVGSGFYSFSIFITPIEDEFGWSRGAISLTMSIFLVISGLMGPVVGRIIGRFGPRKVMLCCAAGAGACFMLVSLTFSLWYFYTVYALLAIMACGIGVIPVSNLLAGWFSRLRGTATGITMVGISAGGLALAPFVGIITVHFGWKAAFFIIGLAVWLIALPVIYFVIKDSPGEMGLTPDGMPAEQADAAETVAPSPQPDGRGQPAGEVLRSRAFWFVFAAFFFAPFAQMGILQHQVPMLMDIRGASQPTAAAALGLTAGIGGLGKLYFGRISDIWPFRYVVLLCFGLQAAAVLMLLHVDMPVVLWLFTVVFGFSMGGVIVLMPLAVGRFWGLLSFGVILGAIWIANSLGGAMGTYINGLAYDYFGHYNVTLYFFVAAYIMAIASFFLAGRLGDKGQPPRGKNQ